MIPKPGTMTRDDLVKFFRPGELYGIGTIES